MLNKALFIHATEEGEKQAVIENSVPLDVLKLRLAKGEITKKEFDEIKDAIKGLNLIAKMGDSEAADIIKQLKIKLKNQ